MKRKPNPQDDQEPRAETGLGGILSGLTGLVGKLSELAQTGEELRRTGEIQGSGQAMKGIYGFTVKVGLGGETPKVEPFGNLRTDRTTGKTVAQEVREPLVDLFEEGDASSSYARCPGLA